MNKYINIFDLGDNQFTMTYLLMNGSFCVVFYIEWVKIIKFSEKGFKFAERLVLRD